MSSTIASATSATTNPERNRCVALPAVPARSRWCRRTLASDRQNVREIHEELARQYEALVHQAELRSPLRIGEPYEEVNSAAA